MKTGAVAPDVGRLEPGKLDIKEKQASGQQKTTIEESRVKDEQSGDPSECSNDGDLDGPDREPCDSINGDTETDSGFKDESDLMENKSDDGDFEIFQNCNNSEEIEANDNDDDKTTSMDIITDRGVGAGGKNKGDKDEETNKNLDTRNLDGTSNLG